MPSTASAQVVINELGVLDSPDWIEIYNYEEQPVDLSLFLVKDGSENELDLNGILESKGFLSFDWSNRLNNDGDVVKLIRKSDGYVVEELKYGDNGGVCVPSNDAGSIGKLVDGQGGSDKLERYSVSSKGKSNATGTVDPCPTPTPEPTETPTPSPKPTNTSTPTPTPKPSPTNTLTPTPKPTVESTGDSTLGIQGLSEEVSPTPSPKVDTQGKVPFMAVLFILAGLGLTGVALYPFLKTLKTRYNFGGERKD